MNENQKDRLLKLAENNPELAKDVVEILKEEKHASSAPKEPVAVTIVKPEEEKIVITQSQKRAGIMAFLVPGIGFILAVILFDSNISSTMFFDIFFPLVIICIILSWFFTYKAGMPLIKKKFNKNFEFEKKSRDLSTKKVLKNHFKFW